MAATRQAIDPGRRWLSLALAGSATIVGTAAVLRVADSGSGPTDIGGRLFAVLVAAAFLNVAVLSRARATGPAWFATLIAAGLGVVEVVAALRSMELVTDGASTPIGLAVAVLALLAASGIAVANVLRPRRLAGAPFGRLAAGAVVLVFAGVVLAAEDLAPIRVAGRVALATVVLGLVGGALLDAQHGVRVALARWRSQAPARSGGRSLFDHLADELLPWRADGQSRAREGERARLAADLHAFVLPDLRRAAAAVESAGAPEPAVAGVRRALEDVEQLMHGRQSIVLDEFGLVAALEWLAERTEDQGDLRVELQLEGNDVERREAVRPEVARAAFRIAMLAVDNVERHARATTAVVRLRVDRDDMQLTISDDGEAVAGWSRIGGRGVADMRNEARSSDGDLRLQEHPRATVDVRWRSR